jgi:Phosphatidylserine/phosphatidylglycerophosphate/cardiolipin synthases and related enzymes
MKKILNFLFSRLIITWFLIFLQIFILFFILWKLSSDAIYVYIGFMILGFLILVYIMNEDKSPSLKIPWIILIFVMPVFGGPLYMMFGHNNLYKRERKKLSKIREALNKNIETNDNISKLPINYQGQSKYINKQTGASLYQNTSIKYFELGDKMFVSLLEDLKKAEKFIFLEYFIIEDGLMWNSILKILIDKVKEGVDVRVMFDDLGCIVTLPNKYDKYLQTLGIKCTIFNPFKPILSIGHNNRDHRKITIIDGYIGYTGGNNIADEYINQYPKHGHWKDTSVRLEGESVYCLTRLFLSSWNYFNKSRESIEKFKPNNLTNKKIKNDGLVQIFGDNPIDKEHISETVYLNMIYSANDYIYINSPYLIMTYELKEALLNAAKRGVDVRITTPMIPDKWYVHLITQSSYKSLILDGVKIYEYKPGFNHAKSMIVDDKLAIIGTINLDYRSLLHHFECGVWIYDDSVINDMKIDYERTLKECLKINKEMIKNLPFHKRWMRNIIQFFAPLL